MLHYYILDADNRPVRIHDMIAWAQWFEDANRTVAWTQITSEITVSTVFLGIDHRHFGKGPPILFETMVFGPPGNKDIDSSMYRYSSWDDAEIGHAAIVRRLRAQRHVKSDQP